MLKLKASQYVDLVRRSGLIEQSRLDALLAAFNDLEAADSGIVCSALIETGLLTDWQNSLLREGKCRGFFLGKYKLLGQLGRGGMGAVYLAEHTVLKRRVAIKVLQKELVGQTSFLERFYVEAQSAAALDHPNVVRCYDADEADGTHYFVMEYVIGESLQALVKQQGPLEYRLAAEYIRQAALGLEHAHRAGIVHRDVKPANILVDGAGIVKVLDLGLARVQDDSRMSLTVAHDERMIGTIDYQAPEQAVDCHAVDARADLYSLGCTLYFLLAGHAPFGSGTLAQRVLWHQTTEPPDIRTVRKDAPQPLLAACRRMMAKKPRDRYSTAAEVATVLGAWLDPSTTARTSSSHAAPTGGTVEAEIGLAPDKDEPPSTPARRPPRKAVETKVEVDLSDTTTMATGGLSSLLDEVMHAPTPAASLATPAPQATNWTAQQPQSWTSDSHVPRRKKPAEPDSNLWLLIGAGILLGAIVLGVAYSAIWSFTTEPPPTTIEYRKID